MSKADEPIPCENCQGEKTSRAVSAAFAHSEGRVVADGPFVTPLDTPPPSPWKFREDETDYQEPYPYPPDPNAHPPISGWFPMTCRQAKRPPS